MMVESWPDSNSFPDSSNSGCSEMNRFLLVRIRFIVAGSCSVYHSYGDFFVADGFIRSAKRVSDSPVLSFVITIFLFLLNLSFIVLVKRSILPFPLWSSIGHSTWFIYHFLQNSLNFSLLKIVAGSVFIVFGMPCLVMYFCTNSITFSVFGLRKNFASGHPVK